LLVAKIGNASSRETLADRLIAEFQPWQIAWSFHQAAVVACPVLDSLIGHLKSWPNDEARMDVTLWMIYHASTSDISKVLRPERGLQAPGRTEVHHRQGEIPQSPLDEDFMEALDKLTDKLRRIRPAALLRAWRAATGSDASALPDLKDAEWRIIRPFLSVPIRYRRNRRYWFSATRLLIDGMHYRDAYGVEWQRIPTRYGRWQNVYKRYRRYRTDGTFAGVREAAENDPNGKRLADWLRSIDAAKAE